MDAAASYLDEVGVADGFVLIKLEVKDRRALMNYEDGRFYQSKRTPGLKLSESFLHTGHIEGSTGST